MQAKQIVFIAALAIAASANAQLLGGGGALGGSLGGALGGSGSITRMGGMDNAMRAPMQQARPVTAMETAPARTPSGPSASGHAAGNGTISLDAAGNASVARSAAAGLAQSAGSAAGAQAAATRTYAETSAANGAAAARDAATSARGVASTAAQRAATLQVQAGGDASGSITH